MPEVTPVVENSVQAQPISRARFQAADFGSAGETIGRAVQGGGQAIEQFRQTQDHIDELYDTAAVRQADAAVQERLAPIRASVLSAVGTQAVGAKAEALKQLDAIRQEYAGSFANPRQEAMFSDAFQRLQVSEHMTYDEHEAKQSAVAAQAGAAAVMSSSLDRAVSLYKANPDASKAALADALTQIRQVHPGLPEPAIKQLAAATLSAYHVQVATQIRDVEGDALGAKHYVDENGGSILPEDAAKFYHSIKGDVDDAITDAALGQVLAGHGPATPEDARSQRSESAAMLADPIRGRGTGAPVAGGTFRAARPGGKSHDGIDYPAPAGTPVHPPMQGVVVNAWFDKEHSGGWSVLVRHPNGRVTGYADMRNVNVKAGDAVTPDTVIGAVGSSGATSTGNHLHYRVTAPDGKTNVDPSTVSWQQGDLPPPVAGTRDDEAGLLKRAHDIATAQNLTPHQYDMLVQKITRQTSLNDHIRERSQQDARDAVGSLLDKLGDKFTNITQIPADVRQRLKPGELNSYRELADRNSTGGDTQAGGQAYLDMFEMSGNPATQDQFAQADLSSLASKMSKAEFLSLRKAQITIRNGGGRHADLADVYARSDAMVSRYIPQVPDLQIGRMTGKDKTLLIQQQRAQIKAAVRAEVMRQQEASGKKLTDDEISRIARAQIAPVFVHTPGRLWGESVQQYPHALAPAVPQGGRLTVNVPQTARAQIIDAWNRHHRGKPITENDIAHAYLALGGGIK